MSLIGGCFQYSNNIEQADLLRLLNTYHCLTTESTDDNKTEIIHYSRGVFFSKGKTSVRSMISSGKDSNGNTLMMLGYSNLQRWKAWNREKGCMTFPQVFPNNYSQVILDMEGEFAAFYFDASTETLHIINDRFGGRPVYYTKTKDAFYFCSNIVLLTQLCRLSVELDPIGLMQIFRFSHSVDHYTHIKHIERLPSASHITVTQNTYTRHKYWQLHFEPEKHLDPVTYSRQVYSAFQEGVCHRARLIQKGIVTLSGGLDSRLIAGTLPDDVDFSFYTFYSRMGSPFLNDLNVAADIARILHRSHLSRELPSDSLSALAGDLTALTGGQMPMIHSFKSMPPVSYGCDLYMGGGPGDNLVGSYVPSIHAALESQTDTYVNYYTKIPNPRNFLYFFNQEIFYAHQEQFQQILQDSFDNIQSPTAAHKISAWCLLHRQPGLTFGNASHSHPYMTQMRPHLSYAYNDLLLKLPAVWLYQKQFYKYMIYHCLPHLRQVVYANTGKCLDGHISPSHLPLWYYKYCSLKRRLAAGWKQLSFSNAVTPSKGFDLVFVQRDPVFTQTVEDILMSHQQLREYFNIDQCVRYIRDVKSDQNPEVSFYCKQEPVGFLAGIAYLYQWLKSIE